ncbi:MAG: glycosyltransferase [Nitrospirae bacterium]|nr:MAG: glycosyltransferase [Nitrospirota bacterium]
MFSLSEVSPKVSIIMNCLNCAEFLREAIDSVYSQTFQSWEIIFWDNASTDESPEIVKDYDAKIRYFKGDETVPLYKARNFALDKARGEFIAFLDCDDYWHSEKLARQTALFADNPGVDFIYGNYYILNMQENKTYQGLSGAQPSDPLFRSFMYSYPINLQTVMLRRSLLEKFGGSFDETLRLCGDYDLFMRMVYSSSVAYIPEPLVHYRVHQNMCSMKYMESYPAEMEYILGKFMKLGDDFEVSYRREIEYFKAKIGYWRARTEMAKGHPDRARNELGPYRRVDYKFFVLYLITYLPKFFWDWAHGIGRKTYY